MDSTAGKLSAMDRQAMMRVKSQQLHIEEATKILFGSFLQDVLRRGLATLWSELLARCVCKKLKNVKKKF